MEEKDFYTKLTLEKKLPDDFGPTIYSAQITVWDSNMEDMFNMFKKLLLSDGFTEKQFNDYICSLADTIDLERED